MLIDNKEVQLSDFTVDTDINKVSFKQSSGRTSYRSRSLSYRSKLSLEFEDADTATEFVEDITALEVIPMVLEENDISPYGDELEVSGGDGTLNFYLERAPTFKVDGYNNVTVELRTLLSKDNITYPTTYNSTILDTLPYDWKYRENIYTQFNNNTTLAGINYNTQNSTTGRSLRLQFRLLRTEYLELRKFIFNKRYTPFAYNSLVGGFSVDTMMVIGNYSMSFTGKLYNITLILEEQ